MGKASKWIRALLGLKKPDPNPDPPQKPPTKKKWSFAKSRKEKHHHQHKSQHGAARGGYNVDDEASKHAIAVASATAAVAEAAVRTAQAAAAAVELTSRPARSTSADAGGGGGFSSVACVGQNRAAYGSREEWAAVTIQSHFRAYLSRRALRALKALVKIQALVRGHISRKQAADNLRRMQALLRVQARARAGRILISEAQHWTTKSSDHLNHTAPTAPEKFEQRIRAGGIRHENPMILKRNGSKSNDNTIYSPENARLIPHRTDRRTSGRSWEQGSSFTRINTTDDDERSDKILEVDPGKPHVTPRSKNISHSCQLIHHQYSRSISTSNHTNVQSPSSGEVVQSLRHLELGQDGDEVSSLLTTENSPLFYSASSTGRSSKRALFTPPTKSDGTYRSCLSGYYVDHPNYMTYTESSKAKVRSLSAPKQRPQYERSSSMSRYSVHGYGDSRINTSQKAFTSALQANFTMKAYPGSGRLDRLGMPVRGDVSGYSGGHWLRY